MEKPAPPIAARLDPTTDPPQTEVMPTDREYDRFQDKTSVKVEGIRPQITKGESRIFINLTASFDGSEVKGKPEKVAVNLLSVADDFQYVDQREGLQFILLINDKRVRVPAKFVKAGVTRDAAPKSLETFVAIIDADVLIGMATADSVEAQLGGAEFKLGVMEQSSLRKFCENVGLLAPAPKPALPEIPLPTPGTAKVDAVSLHLAQMKIDEAQERVDAATTACLKKLEDNKSYVDAVKVLKDLEAKKEKLSPGAERADVSQRWLEAKAKVSLIKSSALLEDADVTAARRQLADAQAALRALQQRKPGK